jgi:hypothetical protein
VCLPGPSWTFLPLLFQSAVSLTGSQTWQNGNSKRRLQIIENVQEGKRHQKKRHLAAFVFVPSVFGEKLPTAEF